MSIRVCDQYGAAYMCVCVFVLRILNWGVGGGECCNMYFFCQSV